MTYLTNIVDSLRTTVKGMQVTFKNLLRPEITVQYPEEQMTLPEGYRGVHTLDQDLCIYCFQCAKVCPVDCIEMRADRVEKKFLSWEVFTVDYNKCLFCDLCVEVCPKECIYMDRREGSAKFALITDDRPTLNLDLLTWKGLSETDQGAIQKLKEKAAAGDAPEAAAAGAPPIPGKPAKKAAPPVPGVPPTPGAPKAPPKVPPKTPNVPKTPPKPGGSGAPKTPNVPKSPNVPPTPNVPPRP